MSLYEFYANVYENNMKLLFFPHPLSEIRFFPHWNGKCFSILEENISASPFFISRNLKDIHGMRPVDFIELIRIEEFEEFPDSLGIHMLSAIADVDNGIVLSRFQINDVGDNDHVILFSTRNGNGCRISFFLHDGRDKWSIEIDSRFQNTVPERGCGIFYLLTDTNEIYCKSIAVSKFFSLKIYKKHNEWLET